MPDAVLSAGYGSWAEVSLLCEGPRCDFRGDGMVRIGSGMRAGEELLGEIISLLPGEDRQETPDPTVARGLDPGPWLERAWLRRCGVWAAPTALRCPPEGARC